jgi:hypothetical protein
MRLTAKSGLASRFVTKGEPQSPQKRRITFFPLSPTVLNTLGVPDVNLIPVAVTRVKIDIADPVCF